MPDRKAIEGASSFFSSALAKAGLKSTKEVKEEAKLKARAIEDGAYYSNSAVAKYDPNASEESKDAKDGKDAKHSQDPKSARDIKGAKDNGKLKARAIEDGAYYSNSAVAKYDPNTSKESKDTKAGKDAKPSQDSKPAKETKSTKDDAKPKSLPIESGSKPAKNTEDAKLKARAIEGAPGPSKAVEKGNHRYIQDTRSDARLKTRAIEDGSSASASNTMSGALVTKDKAGGMFDKDRKREEKKDKQKVIEPARESKSKHAEVKADQNQLEYKSQNESSRDKKSKEPENSGRKQLEYNSKSNARSDNKPKATDSKPDRRQLEYNTQPEARNDRRSKVPEPKPDRKQLEYKSMYEGAGGALVTKVKADEMKHKDRSEEEKRKEKEKDKSSEGFLGVAKSVFKSSKTPVEGNSSSKPKQKQIGNDTSSAPAEASKPKQKQIENGSAAAEPCGSGALVTKARAEQFASKDAKKDNGSKPTREDIRDHKHAAKDPEPKREPKQKQKQIENNTSKGPKEASSKPKQKQLESGSAVAEPSCSGALVTKAKVEQFAGKDEKKEKKGSKPTREDSKDRKHVAKDPQPKRKQLEYSPSTDDQSGSGALVTEEKAEKLASKDEGKDDRKPSKTATYDSRNDQKSREPYTDPRSDGKALEYPAIASESDAGAGALVPQRQTTDEKVSLSSSKPKHVAAPPRIDRKHKSIDTAPANDDSTSRGLVTKSRDSDFRHLDEEIPVPTRKKAYRDERPPHAGSKMHEIEAAPSRSIETDRCSPSPESYSEHEQHEQHLIHRRDKGKARAVRSRTPSPSPEPEGEDVGYSSHSSDDTPMRKWEKEMDLYKIKKAEYDQQQKEHMADRMRRASPGPEDERRALTRRKRREESESDSESEVGRRGKEVGRKARGEVGRRRKVKTDTETESSDSSSEEERRVSRRGKGKGKGKGKKKEPMTMNINLSNSNNITF